MADPTMATAASACPYPLLVKPWLLNAVAFHGEQQIVYRGESRYTLRTFRDRIGRLAWARSALGVRPGNTVAVMDWDSHR